MSLPQPLRALALLAVLVLAGCAAAPPRLDLAQSCAAGEMPARLARIPMPAPHPEPRSRYGNLPSYVVFGRTYHVLSSARGYDERGIASWYGARSQGKLTSSLQPYDLYQYTAASKVLPLPTWVRVTNLANGRCVVVRVNDRGPFVHGRIIDLSYIAALRLGVVCNGTAPVRVQAINADDPASIRALSCPAEAGYVAQPPAPAPPAAAPALPPAPLPGITPPPAPVLPSVGSVQPPYTGSAPPSVAPVGSVSPPAQQQVILQLGAYGVRSDAERAVQRLRDNQLNDATIVAIELHGQPLWAVRIGPLDAAAAAALQPRLILLGLPVQVLQADSPPE